MTGQVEDQEQTIAERMGIDRRMFERIENSLAGPQKSFDETRCVLLRQAREAGDVGEEQALEAAR